MITHKGFVPVLIVIIISAVLLGAGALFYTNYSNNQKIITPSPSPNQVACTQDAKLCPDGTAVGRSGPKCEFSPCPLSPEASAKGDTPKESTASADLSNWKTYTYKNMSFKYPNDWIVVFDSEISGQPNGFDLHIIHKDSEGYAPDGLFLSTYNNRRGTVNDYILKQDRKFTQTSTNENNIQFELVGTSVYASCASYRQNKEIINICNQILSTFKFTQ